MRKLMLGAVLMLATACGQQAYVPGVGEAPLANDVTSGVPSPASEEMETDSHVMTPMEEQDFVTSFDSKATTFKFAQTIWNECADPITGNYSTSNCSKSRNISVMLKTFMGDHMYKCVNKGLAAQGGGEVDEFHVVHAGIFGDPRHSPKSLHSENRAIDIKSLKVKLTSGAMREYIYAGTKNRAFYSAFRKCWGEVVHTYNRCPYASGVVSHTGSIGWENKDHQYHLHTSIPYCVAGKYGSNYFQR